MDWWRQRRLQHRIGSDETLSAATVMWRRYRRHSCCVGDSHATAHFINYTVLRDRILGRNPDKSLQKSEEFSSLLFTVTATALPWDFYFFKLTQPLTVSSVHLLYTVKEKGGNHNRKPYPLPCGLRNIYRNLKSENSQDYAKKPERTCLMNSASVVFYAYKYCTRRTDQS